MPNDNMEAAWSRRSDRYGRQAQIEAEARHLLYLTVRGHLHAGWDRLPEGLTRRNLRDLAIMAKARKDHRIHALCEAAAARAAPEAGETMGSAASRRPERGDEGGRSTGR